jgi:ABC-type transport system involved in multi-copper enzyme maturation permease subunit
MSTQTGIETPASPASRQLSDRLRHGWIRLRYDPNPLWMREMRQSARLNRTPVILMIITILMTMLLTTIGGLMTAERTNPAKVGQVLFQVFFSLAFFVVSLVGPALAANSIASEREGRTWESVLLTGMRPAEITRGKFLAAFTAIAQYIVMLAPVGALPFLFGGITPMEVVAAFAFLFLIAALAVAFGLAISSKMSNLRTALLLTLLLAVPISATTFGSFGVGMSFAAHKAWPGVDSGMPVWLPMAYVRAPFDWIYFCYLIVLPAAFVALPAWFLYELTKSNLTSVTDDRSYGLKRWYLACSPIAACVAMIPVFHESVARGTSVGTGYRTLIFSVTVCLFFLHLLFGCFLFASEAIGPSRRVKVMTQGASRLRRFLSPGVVRAARLQLLTGILLIGVMLLVTFVLLGTKSSKSWQEELFALGLISSYPLGFFVFLLGIAAYYRARSRHGGIVRLMLVVYGFTLSTVPWIVAIVAGLQTYSPGAVGIPHFAAAPSPFYMFYAIAAFEAGRTPSVVVAQLICAGLYAAIGAVLLRKAGARCKTIVDEHDALLRAADERLAAEDAPPPEEAAAATESET